MQTKSSTIHIGYKYWLVHFCIEIISFHILYTQFATTKGGLIAIYALIFDLLAFVPQFIFGDFFDRNTKIRFDYIAVAFLGVAVILSFFTHWRIPILLFLTTGNAILHEVGAVVTTKASEGKLAHSALFVSGGSFGLILGQTMAIYNLNILFDIIPVLAILLIVCRSENILFDSNHEIPKFDIVANPEKRNVIIIVAFCVVTVRSFIGYAIPITWKKELWQSFLLFFVMGFGKALGGVLADRFGAKKVGVISTIACIPFLVVGDDIMVLSVLGVFMFSMTMSITFGMLLSVLNDQPGLAFGITTVGLFIGLLPGFFFYISKAVNIMLVTVLSIACSFALYKTLKG